MKVLWKEQINLGRKIRGVGKGLSYLLWIGQCNVQHSCIGHGIAEAYWHGKLQQWVFRNDISVFESYRDVSDRGSWGLAVLLSNLVCSIWWEAWDNSYGLSKIAWRLPVVKKLICTSCEFISRIQKLILNFSGFLEVIFNNYTNSKWKWKNFRNSSWLQSLKWLFHNKKAIQEGQLLW